MLLPLATWILYISNIYPVCVDLRLEAYPRGSSRDIEVMARPSWRSSVLASRSRSVQVGSNPYIGQKPLACAWDKLDKMQSNQFIWQPYSVRILYDNSICGLGEQPLVWCGSVDQLRSSRMASSGPNDEAIQAPPIRSTTMQHRHSIAWHGPICSPVGID